MFQDLFCFRQMPNRKQIDYTITNTQTRKGFNLAFSCHGHKAAESMTEKLRFEPDNSINNYVNVHIYTYTSRERERKRKRKRERERKRKRKRREREITYTCCMYNIYIIYILDGWSKFFYPGRAILRSFANLSRTPCLSFAEPMLSNNSSYEGSFITCQITPNYHG